MLHSSPRIYMTKVEIMTVSFSSAPSVFLALLKQTNKLPSNSIQIENLKALIWKTRQMHHLLMSELQTKDRLMPF